MSTLKINAPTEKILSFDSSDYAIHFPVDM
jgi:hypothetical protein